MFSCFRPADSSSARRDHVAVPQPHEQKSVDLDVSFTPRCDEILPSQPIEPIRPHVAADSTNLCFDILSDSHSIISIFSDTSDGSAIYQNDKSLNYYGDLNDKGLRASLDLKGDESVGGKVLKELLSFEKNGETEISAILSRLEAAGSWIGCIKVPFHPSLKRGRENESTAALALPAVTIDSHSASTPKLNASIAGYSSTCLEQETSSRLLQAREMSLNLQKRDSVDEGSASLAFEEVSATFRKAPARVKSFLLPSIYSSLTKSIGSVGSRGSVEAVAGPSTLNQEKSTRDDSGSSKKQSSQNALSRAASEKSTANEVLSGLSPPLNDDLRSLLSSEMPQIRSNTGKPPRVPSQAFESVHGQLNAWEEVDEGVASAFGSTKLNQASTGKSFLWHEISIKKRPHPATGEPIIVVTQTDVTIRVAMEKAMLTCTATQLNMMSSIFPLHVVEYFNQMGPKSSTNNTSQKERPTEIGQLARSHKDVTILFMDIVGFTSMSKEVEPSVVMKFLNDLFGLFDNSIEHYKVQKVETAGDCYIVAAGVLSSGADGYSEVLSSHNPRTSATRVLSFAQLMLHHSRTMKMPHNGELVMIRIGVHTGDCVSGLVGSKLHKFGLFGDTMNTASRMESTSQPGRIQISSSTYALLSQHQQTFFEATGGVEVKGKGRVETHLWIETPNQDHEPRLPSLPQVEMDDLDLILLGTKSNNSQPRNASGAYASGAMVSNGQLVMQDIMASVNGSLLTMSPFAAMSAACRDAVDLLHSIAETKTSVHDQHSSALLQKLVPVGPDYNI